MTFFSRSTMEEGIDLDPTSSDSAQHDDTRGLPLENRDKSRWERIWPALACGAGLFSDGYLNTVIGQVNTILVKIYGDGYKNSSAQQNVASLAFAGTVIGQLFFGWLSDHYSRKWSLMISTSILIVFAALCAGSYGYHGSVTGLFAALTAYRFLIGIGIGGEYSTGSVACAESTGELKAGHRNRYFILFTNVQMDIGFVLASLVPMILVLIFTENHLRATWRVALALGVLPPLSLFYLRLKLKEPEEFSRETMKDTRTPWWLVIKFYWVRLSIVSLIWFIYDFSMYSFSIYSSAWLALILGKSAPLWKIFAWNTVLNAFYLPGAVGGAFLSDWIGPRMALAIGAGLQGLVGFFMSGLYSRLNTAAHVGSFVFVYGVFLSLGEVGPGNNIGLVASKTCATAIRGQYYAVAAAWGKIGAFVGTYVFPIIQSHAPGGADSTRGGQDPFFVSSSLCLLSAVMAFFFLPHIGQDSITAEDFKFREHLERHGWDTRQMGAGKPRAASTDGGGGENGVGV
ncbi:hypothetical protein MMC22_002174 [Lobaria immixta]|nr:hypothetical protein [Lobaria immixta]